MQPQFLGEIPKTEFSVDPKYNHSQPFERGARESKDKDGNTPSVNFQALSFAVVENFRYTDSYFNIKVTPAISAKDFIPFHQKEHPNQGCFLLRLRYYLGVSKIASYFILTSLHQYKYH